MNTEPNFNSSLKLMSFLTWAGAVPLIASALLAWTQSSVLPTTVFIAYSSVILAFMAGSFWGQVLLRTTEQRDFKPVILFTTIVALLIWAALMLAFTASLMWALILLLVGHGLNYAVENQCIADLQQVWYRQLRLKLTIVVCILHGVLLLRFVT